MNMKKVKTIIKNNIFGFVLGGLIFGTVGVYAATYCASSVVSYDNSKSGLESKDVQSAIDELYEHCSKMASSSKYLYYAVNAVGYGGESSGGTLYRTDLNGGNKITIYNSGSNTISS